ncbi:MAG: hypothetical protein H7201_02020 [Candidatus Saccharibacteria bacterium]|nr:hypothetical protein [Microbacteriaceae bacterium]
MKKQFGLAGIVALGLTLAVTAPASAATSTIYVPDDFVKSLSDTRATGHYELAGTGLHIFTEGSTSTDKVAEYVATNMPLSTTGEPSLDYTNSGGGLPGFQLLVDANGDGQADGILVGESSAYGNDWWLNNAAQQFVKDGAPLQTGGFGSSFHGTLDQWRSAFPDAVVKAFGFSLGSGVNGDGVINAINFAGTRYLFGEQTVLNGKAACKNGSWKTSTKPVFTNQGNCVSYFTTRE